MDLNDEVLQNNLLFEVSSRGMFGLSDFLSEESAVLVGYKNVNFEGYGIFSWNLYRTFGVTINQWNFFDEPFPNRIIHSYT